VRFGQLTVISHTIATLYLTEFELHDIEVTVSTAKGGTRDLVCDNTAHGAQQLLVTVTRWEKCTVVRKAPEKLLYIGILSQLRAEHSPSCTYPSVTCDKSQKVQGV